MKCDCAVPDAIAAIRAAADMIERLERERDDRPAITRHEWEAFLTRAEELAKENTALVAERDAAIGHLREAGELLRSVLNSDCYRHQGVGFSDVVRDLLTRINSRDSGGGQG